MSSESILEAAIRYQQMGFSVIPVKRDKKPLIAWTKYQNEAASKAQIEKWWRTWPMANVAIVTGAISGIDVIDVDSDKGFTKFSKFVNVGSRFIGLIRPLFGLRDRYKRLSVVKFPKTGIARRNPDKASRVRLNTIEIYCA